MRGTQHNGRANKKGQAYNVNHNDREFEQKNSKDYDTHIDASKSVDNAYFAFSMNEPAKMMRVRKGTSPKLEKIELDFYKKHFGKHLEQTNENYIRNRHPERCKTIEDVYTNPRTCPQETILQVGKDGEYKDLEKFTKMVKNYCVAYNNSFSNNSMIIDCAIHADETSMHAHVRRVFYVRDKNGNLELAQNKALEQMGYQLPNPEQKRSKYNNRLQTFTDNLRGFWYDLIEKHDKDIKIEREPDSASRSRKNLEKLDYQNIVAKEKLEQANDKLKEANKDLENVKLDADAERTRYQELKHETEELEQIATFAKSVLDDEAELDYSIKRPVFNKNDTIIQGTSPEQVKDVFEMAANMSSYLEQQQRINLQIQRELERKEKDLEQRERQLAREKEQNTLDRRIEIAKAVSEANNEKNREIKGLKSKLSEYQTLERRYPDVRMSLEKARRAKLMRQMEEVAGEVEHGRKRDYGFER